MLPETPSNVRLKRSQIIEMICNRLEQLKKPGSVEYPIINIHGISGMGKTWLIEQIAATCAPQHPIIWLNSDAFRAAEHRSWAALIPQLRQIPGLEDLPSDVEGGEQNDLPSHGGVIEQFGDQTGRLGNLPQLLLLDAVDDLADWKWVQGQIIKPLVEQQQTLIVCTSQTPLFWHFWEVREKCEPFALQPLLESETLGLLEKHGQPLLAKTAHAISDGYPLVLDKFIHLFKNENLETAGVVGPAPALAQFQFSPEIEWVLLTVGMVRRVEIPVMERVLKQFPPEQLDEDARLLLMRTLAQVHEKRLFEPAVRGELDRFKRSLRNAVEQRLLQKDPQKLDAIRLFLANDYYQRALKKPKTEAEALIEWLYFAGGGGSDHEWDQQFDELFREVQRVRENSTRIGISGTGADLVRFFSRDTELLERMRPERYLQVRAKLAELFGSEANLPITAAFTSAVSDAFEVIDNKLSPKTRMDTLREPIETLLRYFLRDDTFGVEQIRALVASVERDQQGVSTRDIGDDLLFLISRGLLSFDRTQRAYKVNPLLRNLIDSTRIGGS